MAHNEELLYNNITYAVQHNKLNIIKTLIENKMNPYDNIHNNMNLMEYSEQFGADDIINFLQTEYNMKQNAKYDCDIM